MPSFIIQGGHSLEGNIKIAGFKNAATPIIAASILSKEEINEIIIKFSQASKIPTHEGVFRVAVGKFIFSAIISDVISSKFIIQKMVGGRRMIGR